MNHSLKPWNTFGIDRCQAIVRAETAAVIEAWQTAEAARLILGEGSNVLFLKDYAGTVIINRIMGIEVRKRRCLALHVGAGENWHQLVQFTLDNDAGSGKPGIDPWLRRIFADPEYWRIRRRATACCAYVDCIELATA
jgi:UDP-N-acetylmuramate dehydrogenase